jgi:hypothetical protein
MHDHERLLGCRCGIGLRRRLRGEPHVVRLVAAVLRRIVDQETLGGKAALGF